MPELKNNKFLRETFITTLKNVKDPFGGKKGFTIL